MKKTKLSNYEKWFDSFKSGFDYRAHEALGSCLTPSGAAFRVWAPNARAVSLVGDFNDWDPKSNPMKRLDGGVWELKKRGLKAGDKYKYAILAQDGQMLWKADPYAYWAEMRPDTASRLCDIDSFQWDDEKWLENRRANKVYASPHCTYEVHLGSWRRKEDGSFLSYKELSKTLVPYVKSLGFTHIELMPVTEYPYDGSWGYQCTGFFAATSRFGQPTDLKCFINACHKAGIGVIMDWSAAHFPKDPHGLVEFDGGRCYEYQDGVKGEHPSWGTRIFDYGRGEVMSFLISSALFWLEEYHMDGIRVDAVASMLYLDYDREPHEWRPNVLGGNENLEAVDFLKRLNEAAFAFDDSVIMVAEESTSWPLVTMPTDIGGLGFNLKWNMGWMNDSLRYIKTDPYFRAGSHRNLTFSFFYAFSENYLLPLSHDEVVHMKGSLYYKMPGEHFQKLAGIRSFWSYMLAHPGKKLLFMGSEFGQKAEWDYEGSLRWSEMDKDPERQKLLEFFRAAGKFYRQTRELWEVDFEQAGFKWICADENERNIIGFIRFDKNGKAVIFACNFSGVKSQGFRLGLPEMGEYKVLFSTDEVEFGGEGEFCAGDIITTEDIPWHYRDQSVLLELPPFSAVFLKLKKKIKKTKKKMQSEVVKESKK